MNNFEITYPEHQVPYQPSGREVGYHVNDEDQFMILTWNQYSKTTKEYSAIQSTWKFQGSSLYLEEVSVKYPQLSWRNDWTDPALLLSDLHLRLAREQVRARTGAKRCDTLIMYPAPIEEENV